ncbi:ribbon-helix-helix domain-containing protein [Serratia proteamaculans]|nr:ribbon-helix-helix domain-containing protein [Serratia proteamaculans]
MKEKKNTSFGIRLNDEQVKYLDDQVNQGKAKNRSEAIQIMINTARILGK